MFAHHPSPHGVVYDLSAGDCAGRHQWTTDALAHGALTQWLHACRAVQAGTAAIVPPTVTLPITPDGLRVPRHRRPPAVDAMIGDACRRAGVPRAALLPGGAIDRLAGILPGLQQPATSVPGQVARAILRELELSGPVESAPRRRLATR